MKSFIFFCMIHILCMVSLIEDKNITLPDLNTQSEVSSITSGDQHSLLEKRIAGGDFDVSVLGFGTWQFGGLESGYWGIDLSQETANTLVNTYLQAGCPFYLDTAESYQDGGSEIQLGLALKSLDPTLRKCIILGSKIKPQNCKTQEDILSHFEDSLERLGVDSIDLYMIHWPLEDGNTNMVFEVLGKLQKEGKIKYIGVSNYGVQQLTEALSTGVKISVNQVVYNLLYRAVEYEIIPFCKEHNIGIFAYMPLMQGLLTYNWKTPDEVPDYRARSRHFNGNRLRSRHGEAGAEKETFETLDKIKAIAEEYQLGLNQLAISWVLHNPAVTCVIVGSTKIQQAHENIAVIKSIQTIPLEVYQKLDEVTTPLKEKLGRNADLWQGGNDSRIK